MHAVTLPCWEKLNLGGAKVAWITAGTQKKKKKDSCARLKKKHS